MKDKSNIQRLNRQILEQEEQITKFQLDYVKALKTCNFLSTDLYLTLLEKMSQMELSIARDEVEVKQTELEFHQKKAQNMISELNSLKELKLTLEGKNSDLQFQLSSQGTQKVAFDTKLDQLRMELTTSKSQLANARTKLEKMAVLEKNMSNLRSSKLQIETKL